MDDPYLVELNVCSFKGVQTEAVYTCFKNELCCDEGCCPKASFNIFRVWYFWITVIGLLFILSGGCKFCRFENRRRQLSAAARRSRNSARFRGNSAVAVSPFAHRSLEMYFGNHRSNELDELINLRQLLVQHEACNVAIDRYVACQNARARDAGNAIEPPSYNSLQLKTTQFNTCDPPPNYSTVCRNFRGISELDGLNIGGSLPQPVEHPRTELSSVHAPVSGGSGEHPQRNENQ
ncbi:hypothetical protein MML48_9g00010136 [Holotrichia oblita]|uniref:Uncharacterized protein n=1 Tax=Holotrichia oblita TaxID=644536 RepID=A0ACB9SHY0_HOLOL|nr:hypothetical protein MML48_9g00010136 [Holotrichia oblita]